MLPHILLRIGGTLQGGPQTWSMGLRFRSATGGDPSGIADIQTRLEGFRDAVRALHDTHIVPSSFRVIMGAPTRITSIRTALINAQGREQAVALVEGNPLAIGPNVANMPQQVALCLSLDTGKPGASNRGRMYLPALSATLDVDGHLDPNQLSNIASEAGPWLKELGNAGSTAIAPQLVPCVVSTVKDTAVPITQVRIGNRLDIQRRRADKEDETYAVSVVPN